MTDVRITQAEADALIALEKRRMDTTVWSYPSSRGCVTVPLVSVDGRESFLLDLRRARIDLAKGTYQNRGRQVVILAQVYQDSLEFSRILLFSVESTVVTD